MRNGYGDKLLPEEREWIFKKRLNDLLSDIKKTHASSDRVTNIASKFLSTLESRD